MSRFSIHVIFGLAEIFLVVMVGLWLLQFLSHFMALVVVVGLARISSVLHWHLMSGGLTEKGNDNSHMNVYQLQKPQK